MSAKTLTLFGSTVLSLAAEKGIWKQSELIKLLREYGCKVSQPGFSAWIYGKHAVNKNFPIAFAEALKLSEPEKYRLSWAFTYGQTKFVSVNNLDLTMQECG